ncbi:dihydroneopterin aldolase [Deinococcus psychrotolerans]|uniref:7,8-dihydroneopterin aldolase n=1 Tax=Deinococcus psychrotolerans TaxID=2489213 RepID=A0A3G8YJW6_9DEIO|nr:dihydroneopterin aldolase [Deinococcus psychrotolerans]AZI41771.1 dihydroneopterin aldolase [Deinococcus psychrotolerans]
MSEFSVRQHSRSKVVLKGLAFHGRHGVYQEEAVFGARFVVDAELLYDFSGISDDLTQAVNYAAAYDLIASIVTGERWQLLEALSGRLASALLADFPQLSAVTVRVHKPHAPLPGVFEDVYAELHLSRAEP